MNFYGDILSCFEEKIKDVMENHVKMRPKYMEISSTAGEVIKVTFKKAKHEVKRFSNT
jgi:hypothetical protein